MVLATREEAGVIDFAKKKIIRLAIHGYWKKVKPIIDEKISKGVGLGWRRTTTPHVRDCLINAVNNVMQYPRIADDGDPKTIYLAIDVFCLIYDTDNNYAKMFHAFLKNVRKDSVLKDIKFGPYYIARGQSHAEQDAYANAHGLEPDCYL